MDNQIKQANHQAKDVEGNMNSFDYSHVNSVARIALYDDLRSAPRVTEIHPAPTAQYIENITSKIYEQAKMCGGSIPYTVIREVSENFIHAQFTEITVSILDQGNTIRFADQGPGISHKDKAKMPGFSSAVEPMKQYIRGVGSGLPIVKEYLEFSHGSITIEDNLNTGSVVTISLKQDIQALNNSLNQPYASYDAQHIPIIPYQNQQVGNVVNSEPNQYLYNNAVQPHYNQQTPEPYRGQYQQPQEPQSFSPAFLIPQLNERERDFLIVFLNEEALGVTDISKLTGTPISSTHVSLTRLEELGLIKKVPGIKKRELTQLGYQVTQFILS